ALLRTRDSDTVGVLVCRGLSEPSAQPNHRCADGDSRALRRRAPRADRRRHRLGMAQTESANGHLAPNGVAKRLTVVPRRLRVPPVAGESASGASDFVARWIRRGPILAAGWIHLFCRTDAGVGDAAWCRGC